MTTTDEIALLSSIHANPLDRTGRMVLADYLQEQGRDGEAIALRIQTEPDEDRHRTDYAAWLEETAGLAWYTDESVTAERNPGAMARAELIHIQCVLGRYPNASDTPQPRHMTPTRDWLKLRDREHELRDKHAADFRKGPKCEDCAGTGTGTKSGRKENYYECDTCHGTGDAGGLMQVLPSTAQRYVCLECMAASDHPWVTAPLRCPHCRSERLRRSDDQPNVTYRHRVDWVRGFPLVHCTLGECVAECLDCVDYESGCRTCKTCNDTRTVPSPWLLSVVRHHPGVSFRVTDRESFRYLDQPDKFGWERGRPTYNRAPSEALPPFLYDLIPPVGNVYSTADAAHSALGRAMWLWGWLELNKPPHPR